jgi:hypothetical protein
MFKVLDAKLKNATHTHTHTHTCSHTHTHTHTYYVQHKCRMQANSILSGHKNTNHFSGDEKRLWMPEYKTERLITLGELIYLQLSGFMHS